MCFVYAYVAPCESGLISLVYSEDVPILFFFFVPSAFVVHCNIHVEAFVRDGDEI